MLAILSSTAIATAALAAVLGLVWLVARVVRLTGLATHPVTRGRSLSVQESVALDGRHRLTLVRCDGRRVLLLTGGAHDVVVGWLPDPEPPR